VHKRFFKPPKDLVQEWPEVFEDLYMNTMPIEYLHSIRLEFHNGRIWEIDIEDHVDQAHSQTIADRLIQTLHEYSTEIKRIDFQIDIDRLKQDINDRAKKLL
jgi:hypothetical protein